MHTGSVFRAAFVAAALAAAPARAQQSPATLVVGPTAPLRTIAAAVAQAPAGARIVVEPGTYREPTIVVDRRLTIEGRAGAVVDGEGQRALIVIAADDVTIRNLTLRRVGTSYTEDRAAVRAAKVARCAIEGNRIEDAFFGVYLASVTGCRVVDNVIAGHAANEASGGNGIHVWSSTGIQVEGNRVSGHRDGVYFEFVRESAARGNISERNLRYGLHFMYSDDCEYERNTFRRNLAGVAVMYTRRVVMRGNRFEDNWGAASYGLLFKEVLDSRIEDNRFTGNTVGLFVDGANRLVATGNLFARNGHALKLMASTEGAHFGGNDFVGNTFDVSTNSRQNYTTFAGNYWDDYRGYDLDRDGAGDVPHHPVRLFSLIVEHNPPAMILFRGALAGAMDAAERVFPVLTPHTLVDTRPAIRSHRSPR